MATDFSKYSVQGSDAKQKPTATSDFSKYSLSGQVLPTKPKETKPSFIQEAVAPYVARQNKTMERYEAGKMGVVPATIATAGNLIGSAFAPAIHGVSKLDKATGGFGKKVIESSTLGALGRGIELRANQISDIPAVQKFAVSDLGETISQMVEAGQEFLNILPLPKVTKAISRGMTPLEEYLAQEARKRAEESVDKNIRKAFEGQIGDVRTLEDNALRAKKGLELVVNDKDIQIPDVNAPLGSGAKKTFDIAKSSPNEVITAINETGNKIAQIGRQATVQATTQGMKLDLAQANAVIDNAVASGDVTPAMAGRMKLQLEQTGGTPTGVHDWVEGINQRYQNKFEKGTIEDTQASKLANDVARVLRGQLDTVVDRKGYAEAYANNQALKKLLVSVAKKANKKVDFGDISTNVGLDTAFSILTGNPAYMARTLAESSLRGIIGATRKNAGMKAFRQASADVGRYPTTAKFPGKNPKLDIRQGGLGIQSVPISSRTVSIPRRAMTRPENLLPAPRPKAIPLGGEVLGQKVNAKGEVIRAPLGKSTARAVPAQSGKPRVNPKTGRMEKTFTSEVAMPHKVPVMPEKLKGNARAENLHKQITDNVKAQERAYKRGDTAKMSALKKAYNYLIKKWEELVQRVKDTPGKEGGFANFNAPLGKNKKIDRATKREIVDAIDYLRVGKKTKNIDDTVSRLAQKFGVSEDIGSAKLANKFQDILEKKPLGDNHLAKATQALREAKGLSASDIMAKHPDINLKRDVTVTDIHGKKSVIPEGEALTPYELKGNKVLLQDGETYIVSKNQWQNVKGQSVSGEAKPFAPELAGTEETTLGTVNRKKMQENYRKLDAEVESLKNEIDNNGGFADAPIQLKEKYKAKTTELHYAQANLNDFKQGDTKYSSYTLPGGENYKEILVKAPKAEPDFSEFRIEKLDYDTNKPYRVESPNSTSHFATKAEAEVELAKIKKTYGEIQQDNKSFKSSHWDEPNVLSHIRMNERTYNGKKVAFMEELQSDWAREGRAKGFVTTKDDVIASAVKGGMSKEQAISDINKLWDNPIDSPSNPTTSEWKRVGSALEKVGIDPNIIHEHARGIPSHPLLKNWQEMSVKRALKEAVDSDAEYFAWINGEQTSARYNLATHVKDVSWDIFDKTNDKAKKAIRLHPQSGREISIYADKEGKITNSPGQADWEGKKLDEVLGKGLADSIMSKESGTLSGEGLKFGGEWANNLYDKQVGDIVRKVTGGKVEVLDLGLPIEKKTNEFFPASNIESGGTYIKASSEPLKVRDLSVGKKILDSKLDAYIITDILGDGKFKAVRSNAFKEIPEFIAGKLKGEELRLAKELEETFDISQKTTTQQGIRLTPEIKRLIRGEAPELKQASGRNPLGNSTK